MKPIKAIILTFDEYRAFTEHMILCYENLWPNHPFIFYIPYQKIPPSRLSSNVRYVKSPSDIKGTMRSLLHGLDDEEVVFWCIDDKYPIELKVDDIEDIHNYLSANTVNDVSGLLFCRCRGMLDNKNLVRNKLRNDSGNIFLERKNYKQIWIHQYLKVKVLKYLFDSFPDEIPNAKMMDSMKSKVNKPDDHKLYVTQDNLAVFGESTSRGIITRNCSNSMSRYNLSLPEWVSKETPHEIIIGKITNDPFSRIFGKLTKRFV